MITSAIVISAVLILAAATNTLSITTLIVTAVGTGLAYAAFKFSKEDGFESIEQFEKDKLLVVIVGGGFSGICAAVQLKRRKIPFVVFEEASSIGGTWWYNKYPGCACDLPGVTYSYSFYRYRGERFIPLQTETLCYLKKVSRHFGIDQFIQLNTKVLGCSFDEVEKKWRVKTSKGEELVCTHLVSAVGGLNVPRYPDIPGVESFEGDAIHTARWPMGYELNGKRVAVIGTGSSSTQLISNIADKVEGLSVFQRSPAWVLPPAAETLAPRFLNENHFVKEIMLNLNIAKLIVSGDMVLKTLMTKCRLSRWLKDPMKKEMAAQVMNEDVRYKLLPSIEFGSKRLILSNTYLPSFNKNNVQLVDEGILKITKHGITTEDGAHHHFDTIIFGTGFDSLNSMKGLKVSRNCVSLADVWGDCPNAYNGVMYPGFPNFFILLGPNTILGR